MFSNFAVSTLEHDIKRRWKVTTYGSVPSSDVDQDVKWSFYKESINLQKQEMFAKNGRSTASCLRKQEIDTIFINSYNQKRPDAVCPTSLSISILKLVILADFDPCVF